MRRPTATTVSAESTMALPEMPAVRALCWAARAFWSARRCASLRGSSPFSGVSSIWAGMRCSGSIPIWLSSARRRGEADARISSGRVAMAFPLPVLSEAVGDPALGQIVGRHLAQHLVAGERANAGLAQAAGGVGDDRVIDRELDAESPV